MLGLRQKRNVYKAPFELRHYRSLINIFKQSKRPWHFLYDYLLAKGKYPRISWVRFGKHHLQIPLYSYHDLMTLNEVFFRRDYKMPTPEKMQCIVDIGSNIGISLLYFHKQNPEAKIYGFEPLERNFSRLKKNLELNSAKMENIVLEQVAINTEEGEARFGVESTGRYGGIGLELEKVVTVSCRNIVAVLEEILKRHQTIDLLKIDTEGNEEALIKAIPERLARHISLIYAETDEIDPEKKKLFSISQSGGLVRYKKRVNG